MTSNENLSNTSDELPTLLHSTPLKIHFTQFEDYEPYMVPDYMFEPPMSTVNFFLTSDIPSSIEPRYGNHNISIPSSISTEPNRSCSSLEPSFNVFKGYNPSECNMFKGDNTSECNDVYMESLNLFDNGFLINLKQDSEVPMDVEKSSVFGSMKRKAQHDSSSEEESFNLFATKKKKSSKDGE